MFKRVFVLTIVGLAVSAGSALAQPSVRPHHPRTINGRQHHQAARIAGNVRDGDLTRAEAARLRARSAGIRAEERLYRRTGHGLSPWEVRDLQRDLNRESRAIRRATHNGRTR